MEIGAALAIPSEVELWVIDDLSPFLSKLNTLDSRPSYRIEGFVSETVITYSRRVLTSPIPKSYVACSEIC